MHPASHKIKYMRILSFNNAQELANKTEVLMREFCESKKDLLRGFFPTGKSAEALYANLRNDRFWQQKFQGLQIDEFAQPNHLYLSTHQSQIIQPLQLEDQFETIDPTWTEQQMNAHIQNVISHKIDFALLGFGPNGHIGFHEPGQGDQKFLGGTVNLTEQSFKRVKGATTRTAMTFGAGSFLKAEKIFLIATGEEKEPTFRKFLDSRPTSELPATLLKDHADFTVLTTFKV